MHFPVALKYIEPEKLRYPGWWMDAEHETITTANVTIQETWQAMEELVDAGVARAIGFANAQAQTLYDVMRYARHPISNLQIEHHPYLTQPELIAFANEENISLTAYSSFGPQSFYELPAFFKTRAIDAPTLLEVGPVKEAAARTGRTQAQVLLRWATQRGVAVIPKSNNVGRLKQNLEVFDFDLHDAEMEAINALDKGMRFNDPGYYLKRPLHIFA